MVCRTGYTDTEMKVGVKMDIKNIVKETLNTEIKEKNVMENL